MAVQSTPPATQTDHEQLVNRWAGSNHRFGSLLTQYLAQVDRAGFFD